MAFSFSHKIMSCFIFHKPLGTSVEISLRACSSNFFLVQLDFLAAFKNKHLHHLHRTNYKKT